MAPAGEPKFIVDVNVGRLAKWLRAVGYDTLFIKEADDDTLVRVGLGEGRTILTRDTQIMERRVVATGQLRAILIEDDDVSDQLRQVVEKLNLDPLKRRFSLCMVCNEPLVSIPKEEVRSEVPPYVVRTQAIFRRCPSCRKVYWQGTHWQRMKSELEKVRGEGMADL